jgi:hypothetical protein
MMRSTTPPTAQNQASRSMPPDHHHTLSAACGHTEMLQGATEAGGGLTSTLACFPFATRDGATAGLFAPMLILSTLALDAVTVTATVAMVFDAIIVEGAKILGGTLV